MNTAEDFIELHSQWLKNRDKPKPAGKNFSLCGANFYGADLRGANFCQTNLRGANFRVADGIQVFGPAPTSGRMIYAVWHESGWMVHAGCFWGTLNELKKAVDEKHQSPWYYAVISFLENYKL